MENEILSPLEREDRENDIDEFIVPGVSLEGMDYGTYMKMLRGELPQDPPKQNQVAATLSRNSNTKLIRTKKVTIVTSEQVWKLLKIVAAADRKTVSTYLNDFILESLGEQLKQADRYNRKSQEINDSG